MCIYIGVLVHRFTEANKFENLQGGLETRAGDHARVQAQRLSADPLLLGGGQSCLLFRPSTDWMRPTLIMKANLLYSTKLTVRNSLVTQWLRIHLPMQGTWVRSLVWEGPTCCGATKRMCHNYWTSEPRACALKQEKPRQWEAQIMQPESSPHSLQQEKVCAQKWRPSAAKNKDYFLRN